MSSAFLQFLIDLFTDESSSVRRQETICCLIGFGIGVGCCLIYRIISNLFSNPKKISTRDIQIDVRPEEQHDDDRRSNSRDAPWSEISSSLSTMNLLQDSYHSNSLTAADSGVDCSDVPTRSHPIIDDGEDEGESFLRKYDSDTALHHDRQTATETHVMSYISTEKGLEQALEQTTRFYTDLEHIATDLGTLTKRYSQSQNSLNKYTHRSIDALDWDLQDEFQSPKSSHRKPFSLNSSLTRSSTKSKIRRRLNISINQSEYNESDQDHRHFDLTTSPLRRKHSSVYFGSTDNSSDEENLADETLQITN